MNKLKKIIIGVLCALSLLVASNQCFAQTNVVVSNPGPSAPLNLSYYNANEFGFSVGSGYNLGTAGNLPAAAKNGNLFTAPNTLNLNAGVFYFPWRNLGLEANLPVYQNRGVDLDQVEAGILLRFPLSKDIPVLKSISPYVGLDAVYNWKSVESLSYLAKAGLEFRLNRHWGVFTEARYQNVDFNLKQGDVSLDGGLHFAF